MGVSAPDRDRAAGPVLELDVLGLPIAISGWPEVVEALRLDFSWFAATAPRAGRLEVRIEQRAPDYNALPDVPSAFVTPRNAVYQVGERTIADYSGRALAIFDRAARVFVVQGEQEHLLHEVAYLFALAGPGPPRGAGDPATPRLGDRGSAGVVRVLLPSGGGKSTLAMRALREPGVQPLSDDTPLVDRRGRMHPFPLRIGIDERLAGTLPPEHVRRIRRLEYPDKHVVSIEGFRERIPDRPLPLKHVVIGRRHLGTRAELRPMPRAGAIPTLAREGVVGLGVAQMIEWVLHHGARDAFGMAGLALGRSACCAAALARAQTWHLDLGRDHEANWAAFAPLLAEAA